MNLPRAVDLDLVWRFVDRLPSQDVEAYSELDLRLAWPLGARWELAAVGRNLLHDHHAEFGGGVQVERSAQLHVTRRW
jgi:iron complex outermembrane receptor protein